MWCNQYYDSATCITYNTVDSYAVYGSYYPTGFDGVGSGEGYADFDGDLFGSSDELFSSYYVADHMGF